MYKCMCVHTFLIPIVLVSRSTGSIPPEGFVSHQGRAQLSVGPALLNLVPTGMLGLFQSPNPFIQTSRKPHCH